MKLAFILFAGTIYLSSCSPKTGPESTAKRTTQLTKSETEDMATNDKLKAVLGDLSAESAATTITDVKVEGNTLFVSISYGGGCQEHFFKLVGAQATSRSYPASRAVKLIHTGKQDNCKALLMKTLEIDISDLALLKESGSEIELVLEGWSEPILYKYSSKK
jgi:hypothetical protein